MTDPTDPLKNLDESEPPPTSSNALRNEAHVKHRTMHQIIKRRHHRKRISGDCDALEAVLAEVGDYGRYQKRLFYFMAPFGATYAFAYLMPIFLTVTPKNFWCKVPELDLIDDMALKQSLIAPKTPKGEYDPCKMYDTDYSAVAASKQIPDASTPLVTCKNGYEFDFSEIPYPSYSVEKGWVCDKESFAVLSQSVFFVGAIIGGCVLGVVADKYGRIPALVASNLFALIASVLRVFSQGFYDFAFYSFVSGMSFDTCFMMLYIIALEYIGPNHKTFVANMSVALFFGGCCTLLPWLAYFLKNWRTLSLVTGIPMLAAFMAPFLIPESARWMASKGLEQRAVAVMQKFERINQKHISKSTMNMFVESCRITRKKESLFTLMKSKQLRLMLIFSLIVYMTGAVVYDVLVRLCKSLGFNFFVTITLSAATEIPANALIALYLDKVGRKLFTYVPMFIAGLMALIGIFVPKGMGLVALATLARFTVILGYNAMTQWATELLPTSVRACGSSIIHVSGYISKLLSPTIAYSANKWGPLPLVVCAVSGVFGAVVAMLLPETKAQPMPQSIPDGEKLFDEFSWLGKQAKVRKKGGFSLFSYGAIITEEDSEETEGESPSEQRMSVDVRTNTGI